MSDSRNEVSKDREAGHITKTISSSSLTSKAKPKRLRHIFDEDVVTTRKGGHIGLVEELIEDANGHLSAAVVFFPEKDVTRTLKCSELVPVDRSFLQGDVVASADPAQEWKGKGQSGSVSRVDMRLDLKFTGPKSNRILRNVPVAHVRSLHRFRRGVFVVCDNWLSRIEECYFDIQITFPDGCVCSLHCPDPDDLIPESQSSIHQDYPFYCGQRVEDITGSAFKNATWLRYHPSQKAQNHPSKKSHQQTFHRSGGVVTHVSPSRCQLRPLVAAKEDKQNKNQPPSTYAPVERLIVLDSFGFSTLSIGDKAMYSPPAGMDMRQEISPSIFKEEAAEKDDDDDQPEEEDDEEGDDDSEEYSTEEELEERGAVMHKVYRFSKREMADTCEILLTHTLLDVTWQDASVSRAVPAMELVPVDSVQSFDMWPHDFVVPSKSFISSSSASPSPSSAVVGVVQSVNAAERTCVVRWLNENHDAAGAEQQQQQEPEEEVISVYEVEGHPTYEYRIADIVVALKPEAADEARVEQYEQRKETLRWCGEVLDVENGKILVRWADGSEELMNPNELLVVDDDDDSDSEEEEEDEEEEVVEEDDASSEVLEEEVPEFKESDLENEEEQSEAEEAEAEAAQRKAERVTSMPVPIVITSSNNNSNSSSIQYVPSSPKAMTPPLLSATAPFQRAMAAAEARNNSNNNNNSGSKSPSPCSSPILRPIAPSGAPVANSASTSRSIQPSQRSGSGCTPPLHRSASPATLAAPVLSSPPSVPAAVHISRSPPSHASSSNSNGHSKRSSIDFRNVANTLRLAVGAADGEFEVSLGDCCVSSSTTGGNSSGNESAIGFLSSASNRNSVDLNGRSNGGGLDLSNLSRALQSLAALQSLQSAPVSSASYYSAKAASNLLAIEGSSSSAASSRQILQSMSELTLPIPSVSAAAGVSVASNNEKLLPSQSSSLEPSPGGMSSSSIASSLESSSSYASSSSNVSSAAFSASEVTSPLDTPPSLDLSPIMSAPASLSLAAFPRFAVLSADDIPNYEACVSEHHFFNNSSNSSNNNAIPMSIIRKEWQLLEGSDNLPHGIFVRGFESRMDLFRALLVGPKDTPFFDAPLVFDIQLPADYPASPPLVHFYSHGLRLHPNLYDNGGICLSLLGTWTGRDQCEMWNAAKSNLLQLFVSLQGLVLVPQPFYNEAGHEKYYGTEEGAKNARLYNENAVLITMQHMMRTFGHTYSGSSYLLPFAPILKQHWSMVTEPCIERLSMHLSSESPSSSSSSPAAIVRTIDGLEMPLTQGFKRSLLKLLPRFSETLRSQAASAAKPCDSSSMPCDVVGPVSSAVQGSESPSFGPARLVSSSSSSSSSLSSQAAIPTR